MLVIVMHNRSDYLRQLIVLAREAQIDETAIVEKSDIGIRLIGNTSSITYHRDSLMSAYDKAFVAVVHDEKKAQHFMDLLEHDESLLTFNLNTRGFACTLPFKKIQDLNLKIPTNKKEDLPMSIGDYLHENKILMDLKSTTKNDAIREIAGLLKGAEEIVDFDAFLNEIFEREKMATTGIGHGIALPHARTDGVKDFVVAIGRSKDGIEFGSIDGKPVKLIVLMGTLKERKLAPYLKILAHLSRLLEKNVIREKLLHASRPQEVIDIFKTNKL